MLNRKEENDDPDRHRVAEALPHADRLIAAVALFAHPQARTCSRKIPCRKPRTFLNQKQA
jgi:hypothetical protein